MSGPPDALSYGMAKAAVVALTRAVANALVAYNVTANAAQFRPRGCATVLRPYVDR